MKKKKLIPQKTYLVYCLIFFVSLLITVPLHLHSYKSLINGSSDLRNRIVGARLMKYGINPYFYTWKEEEPETFIDPFHNPEILPNRVAVTPLSLAFHNLLPNEYSSTVKVWYFLSWGAFITSAFILTHFQENSFNKFSQILIFLLFSVQTGWYIHLTLGQIYVWYVLLFSITVFIFQKGYKKLPMTILGITILLRPFYVLFLIPIWFFRKNQLKNISVGIFTSIIFAILISGVMPWKSYILSMLQHTNIDRMNYFNFDFIKYYPTVIEDIHFFNNHRQIYPVDKQNLMYVLNSEYFRLPQIFWREITILFLSVIVYFNYKIKEAVISPTIILVGFIIVLGVELLTPIPRYDYYNIQLLIPLAILINSLEQKDVISLILFTAIFCITSLIIWEKSVLYAVFNWCYLLILFYYAKKTIVNNFSSPCN